MHKHQGSKSI